MSLQYWESRAQSCRNCPQWKLGCRKVTTRHRNLRSPIDILFIGDAPDAESSICKTPYVGATGQELDLIIQEGLSPNISFIITYAMLCPPYTDASRSTLRSPTTEDITACQVNLKYLIGHTSPRAVVAMGKYAQKSMQKLYPKFTSILAPSAILASTHYDLEHERAVLVLKGIEECLRSGQ